MKEEKNMKEILRHLCIDKGVSGSEEELFHTVSDMLEFASSVRMMPNGNIIAEMGDPNAEKHILFDAHADRIGLIVTYINEEGFLKAEPVGGIDLRTLPGRAVTVFGKEAVTGIICSVPPHLSEDGELSKDKIWIDTGLAKETVREKIALGDKILLHGSFKELLGGNIAMSGLDNRSGCAVLIECARLLKEKKLPIRLSLVFSAQEETNEMGAATAAFALNADEAVIVDVGFGAQDGVPIEKSGKLGEGAIISISPVLSRPVTKRLQQIADEIGMNCSYEVCGDGTGTNADRIAAAKGGIPCGVISIPCKNMHTPVEVVNLSDMQQIAKLLSVYAEKGGAVHA